MADVTDSERRFSETRRETLRMEIALSRFFEPDLSDEWREKYGEYLKKHFGTAAEEIIFEGSAAKAEALFALGALSASGIDSMLDRAVELGRVEITVMLLREKRRLFGFSGPDISL